MPMIWLFWKPAVERRQTRFLQQDEPPKMTPNEQTTIATHRQMISDLVTTARAAQSVLALSSHAMRTAALTQACVSAAVRMA